MCDKEGCDRRSTHVVVALVPARGWSLALHDPLRIYCSVELCREHADEAADGRLFDEEARTQLNELVAFRGRHQPDWSRAKYEVAQVDDPFYVQHLKRQRGTVQ